MELSTSLSDVTDHELSNSLPMKNMLPLLLVMSFHIKETGLLGTGSVPRGTLRGECFDGLVAIFLSFRKVYYYSICRYGNAYWLSVTVVLIHTEIIRMNANSGHFLMSPLMFLVFIPPLSLSLPPSHPPTRSPAHPLTHSPAHPLTRSPAHPLVTMEMTNRLTRFSP